MSAKELLDKIVDVILAYKPKPRPKRKKTTKNKRVVKMVVLFFLLFSAQSVIAIGLVNQESPSPTPQKSTSRQEKKETEDNHQAAQTTERGSDKSPFVIKIAPPEHTQNETANAKEIARIKASIGR